MGIDEHRHGRKLLRGIIEEKYKIGHRGAKTWEKIAMKMCIEIEALDLNEQRKDVNCDTEIEKKYKTGT